MARCVKLLGFAAPEDAAGLAAAMGAVQGAPVRVVKAGGLAAIAQEDGGTVLYPAEKQAALAALRVVQLRMETACQLAPFLPADPSQCRCPLDDVAPMMADAVAPLSAALAGPGRCHQWDVILRWQAEAIVAARRDMIANAGGGQAGLAAAVQAALALERAMREAGLHAALADIALAVVPAGTAETETGLTVLLPADGIAALENALGALPESVSAGATADLRGPLPPLSFAAVRVASASPEALAQAWQVLALPAGIDADGLKRQWHECAGRLHPDHGAGDHGRMAEAGAAFRLLRSLLPAPEPDRAWTLAALQKRGARRLLVAAP